MKIIFFGTSEFGVPSLEKLREAGYEIAGVVTQPDKPAGRKQELLPSPVKVWALEHRLKVLQPSKFSESASTSPLPLPRPGEGGRRAGEVEASRADLFIVASYGKIIPKQILGLPKYGTLNLHPSLLPKYRGPSPIQTTILNGDSETGVTLIKLDEEMDHGPILASTKFEIQNSKLYYKDLHDKLATLGAELLIKTLPDYIAGKIKPIPQDNSKATFTKMIAKEDGRIDWNKSSEEIERKIRAFHLWPVAWSWLDEKKISILEALAISAGAQNGSPGKIADDQNTLTVQCGSGSLELQKVQLEGKRLMSAQEFLRGQRQLGDRVLT